MQQTPRNAVPRVRRRRRFHPPEERFMKRFTRKRRLALTAVLAIVVAIAGGAFTASNTFSSGSAGNAGDGSASISGFTISNVSYQLQASDPSYIGGVSFSITPAANEVQVSFNPT